jgi:hypothetical protein
MTVAPTLPDIADALRAQHETERARYGRSLFWLRFIIGLLGASVPVLLWVGELRLGGTPEDRGSLSSYYHYGMRDVFVGILCATGFLLISYRVFQRDFESIASTVAGVGLLGVALLPTARPRPGDTDGKIDCSLSVPGDIRCTALERAAGENTIQHWHFAATVTFVVGAALVCLAFAQSELGRKDLHGQPATRRWAMVTYLGSFLFVLLAVALILAGRVKPSLYVPFPVPSSGWQKLETLYTGEVMVILAFSTAWFADVRSLSALARKPKPQRGFSPEAMTALENID